MIRALSVLASLLLLTAPLPVSGAAKSPAPRARAAAVDWTRVVAATPAGGFVLGNPKAKVKLVEYGSLTCPHCRAFDRDGVPALLSKYVKSGKVSWEFRNYVRDSVDLAAALLIRCNGARTYFPLMRALYNDQPVWFGKAAGTPKDELQKIANLPPQQQFAAMAKVAGLDAWAKGHGLAPARANQCLGNVKSIDRLVEMTSDATEQHPDFQGTPTFIINGALVRDVSTWESLEPKLKAALGG